MLKWLISQIIVILSGVAQIHLIHLYKTPEKVEPWTMSYDMWPVALSPALGSSLAIKYPDKRIGYFTKKSLEYII